jgi:hypothetical protein
LYADDDERLHKKLKNIERRNPKVARKESVTSPAGT